jgi:hypothetical protein
MMFVMRGSLKEQAEDHLFRSSSINSERLANTLKTIMQLLQSQYARESPDHTSWTSKGQTSKMTKKQRITPEKLCFSIILCILTFHE